MLFVFHQLETICILVRSKDHSKMQSSETLTIKIFILLFQYSMDLNQLLLYMESMGVFTYTHGMQCKVILKQFKKNKRTSSMHCFIAHTLLHAYYFTAVDSCNHFR
jgi:hypothetical protein